jgi:hypothetical protein
VRVSTVRRRLFALLLALLPGLLLTGSEHLRVCLHGLIGLADACETPAGQDGLPDCCGDLPEGPIVSSQQSCEGCCVELAAQATDPSAPAPSVPSHAAPFDLPPAGEHIGSRPPRVAARHVERPPAVPGRASGAPTPLRI